MEFSSSQIEGTIIMKNICVYCGSNSGNNPQYIVSAKLLAKALASQNIGLVYGGASVGIMGALADTMLDLGGKVIGVMPQSLVDKEVSHPGLTELKIVNSMHQRKALMAELSDAFIALPGGLGTLEELFEMLTWSQLGYHNKPCAILNIEGYFDGLLNFLAHAVTQGFIKTSHAQMLIKETLPEKLLSVMNNYQAPRVEKWISK